MALDPRISGVVGQSINLNGAFFVNGQATDPFAIRRIDIYQSKVADENLVAQIIFDLPSSSSYPSPATQEVDAMGALLPGRFSVQFDVPSDFVAPETYFDVWRFIGDDPGTGADLDDETLWLSQCNQFWLFQSMWAIDDGLVVPRFGFEPLDIKFSKPEVRTLEVGIMPLPLYDFDFNRIAPLIPHLQASIHIETTECEVLVDSSPMNIGLRQGSFRTNPFVLQYQLDTSTFLRGTYVFRTTLNLPNGETRVSPDMHFTIA